MSRDYINTLDVIKENSSDFLYVSREINPKLAWIQSNKPTPQYHKDEVLKSPKIQELLQELSVKHSQIELEQRIKEILNEIGFDKNLKIIRWLALILIKICKRTCSGIYTNNLNSLKTEMGRCPVIFLPSHRSYADFILMSHICFTMDIAIPSIAAGMGEKGLFCNFKTDFESVLDFHGMWGMGEMLRKTGAFFMRRSYNDDSLYWITFKQYINQLVTKGDLPIEFFIEGTRSRSGKSLMPKYGLLLMVLRAFFLSQVPDIYFVPINISYDRIMEEKLFAFELLGIPKPKESTSAFFKSLSIIKEQYGNIFLTFSPIISAKQFFANKNLNRSSHNLKPLHKQELNDYEKSLIPELAHEIIYKQQKSSVLSTFNLISVILNYYLIKRKQLNFDCLINEINWLNNVLVGFGAFVDFRNDINDSLKIHKNLIELRDGNIDLVWNNIVLGDFKAEKLKGHKLDEKTISYAVPFVMLQIYVNPVLHYVIDAAILVLVLMNWTRITRDELFGHYHLLRSLLSQEFVNFEAKEQMVFFDSLKKSENLKLINNANNLYELGENVKLQSVLCSLLDCFIYTYFTVCSCLLKFFTKSCNEKQLMAKIQEEIEIEMKQSQFFIHPYSMNLDTISNCLNSLSSKNVLAKIRNNASSIYYEISEEEILKIRNFLGNFLPISSILKNKL